MNNLDKLFHLWNVLYDKKQDAEVVIMQFFHKDYEQCINGVVMNRTEYIHHVLEQRNAIASIEFKHKNHMLEADKLFVIYYAKGKNIDGETLDAEIIAYFEFKDDKIIKIHGQVNILDGNPSDLDMKGKSV